MKSHGRHSRSWYKAHRLFWNGVFTAAAGSVFENAGWHILSGIVTGKRKEQEEVMERECYITEEERISCRKVAEAFRELYEESDIVVLDAGRYGYVELQYFSEGSGFNSSSIFDNGRMLFEDLWENWLDVQLLKIVGGTPMEEMDYEDILNWLPEEKQGELMAKRDEFASMAGLNLGEQ